MQELPEVLLLTATSGRHSCIERALRFFIEQDYIGPHTLLIYQNSEINQSIDTGPLPENKRVFLINKHIDSQTNEKYTSLGAIYNDARYYIPDYVEVFNHYDDDDYILPNHITEGVKGMKRAIKQDKIAYKPQKSWFLTREGVQPAENVFEPSIFMKPEHIKTHGYSLISGAQHIQWVNPLIHEDKIFVDSEGVKTFVYNWNGDDIPVYKTSGNPDHPQNFDRYHDFSDNHGDHVISPISREEVQYYYNLVKTKQHV